MDSQLCIKNTWGEGECGGGFVTPNPHVIQGSALVQTYLRDIAGLVPDLRNEANIMTKRVIIFLLVKGLAFSLQKINEMPVKHNKVKLNKTRDT